MSTPYPEHDREARMACVLAEVAAGPGRCARELSKAIGETKSRVYQTLTELEQRGEIVRSVGEWPARWSLAPRKAAAELEADARLRAVEQLLIEAMQAPGWASTPRDVAHKVEHAFVELTRP